MLVFQSFEPAQRLAAAVLEAVAARAYVYFYRWRFARRRWRRRGGCRMKPKRCPCRYMSRVLEGCNWCCEPHECSHFLCRAVAVGTCCCRAMRHFAGRTDGNRTCAVKIHCKAIQIEIPNPNLSAQAAASGCSAKSFVAASDPKTLASKRERACIRLSTLRFANGPKRSMGHVPGAEKEFFLIRGAEADEAKGRPCLWNPVNPCPRGLPGVA